VSLCTLLLHSDCHIQGYTYHKGTSQQVLTLDTSQQRGSDVQQQQPHRTAHDGTTHRPPEETAGQHFFLRSNASRPPSSSTASSTASPGASTSRLVLHVLHSSTRSSATPNIYTSRPHVHLPASRETKSSHFQRIRERSARVRRDIGTTVQDTVSSASSTAASPRHSKDRRVLPRRQPHHRQTSPISTYGTRK